MEHQVTYPKLNAAIGSRAITAETAGAKRAPLATATTTAATTTAATTTAAVKSAYEAAVKASKVERAATRAATRAVARAETAWKAFDVASAANAAAWNIVYANAATVCPINAHLAANRSDRGGFWSIAPPLVFANGTTLSVQGSESHYCEPRANHGPYTAVEVGPADHRLFPELRGHRCQGGRTEVHGWVPVTVILAIVARIGLKTS